MLFLPTLVYGFSVKTPAQIIDYIHYKAQIEGVDVTMALAIANAESNFQPNAKNKTSTASGVFQFLNGTFKTYCVEKYKIAPDMSYKNHPAIQVSCAIQILLEPDGYKHWMASYDNWGYCKA